jgi:hypothetical protein
MNYFFMAVFCNLNELGLWTPFYNKLPATTTDNCTILPALDHHVWDIFFRYSSDTNQGILLKNTTYMDHHVWDIFFRQFRHKSRQLIEEYYLHWTTTFEASFSGSSDTNHGSLLKNTTYTEPTRLRYLFQVVQTQTTAAYWRILPTLDQHVWGIFFR